MRKFKGITLVELLVAMAVFSILMTGVIRLVQPVQQTATDVKIVNYQKANEETVVTYIGEQLRYANNILIAEQGATYELNGTNVSAWSDWYNGGKIDNPRAATYAFLYGMGITNKYGEVMKPYGGTKPNQSDLTADSGITHDLSGKVAPFFHMIIWDGREGMYQIDSSDVYFTGRMFTNVYGDNMKGKVKGIRNSGGIGDISEVSDKANLGFRKFVTGTGSGNRPLYELFGRGYFGTQDLYLDMYITDGGKLELKCDSIYWYSTGARKVANSAKASDSQANPTVGTFELRNFSNLEDGDYNPKIHMIAKTDEHKGISAKRGSTSQIIYILYTTDEDVRNIMTYNTYSDTPTDILKDPYAWGYDLVDSAEGKPYAIIDKNKADNVDQIKPAYKNALGRP